MTLEDVRSAKRLALGGVLLYVLWMLGNSAFAFAHQLQRQREEQQQTLQMLERSRQREAEILRQNNENLARQRVQAVGTARTAPQNKPSGHKMAASAVVNRLRHVNAFGLVASRERLLHCSENHGAWDYTCVFHGDPIKSATWLQFGVLVDNKHILEMSETYPSGAILPPPLSLATR